MTDAPTSRSVLLSLPKSRLVELGLEVGVAVAETVTPEVQADVLVPTVPSVESLVERLGRDDLRTACRARGMDDRALGGVNSPHGCSAPRWMRSHRRAHDGHQAVPQGG